MPFSSGLVQDGDSLSSDSSESVIQEILRSESSYSTLCRLPRRSYMPPEAEPNSQAINNHLSTQPPIDSQSVTQPQQPITNECNNSDTDHFHNQPEVNPKAEPITQPSDTQSQAQPSQSPPQPPPSPTPQPIPPDPIQPPSEQPDHQPHTSAVSTVTRSGRSVRPPVRFRSLIASFFNRGSEE